MFHVKHLVTGQVVFINRYVRFVIFNVFHIVSRETTEPCVIVFALIALIIALKAYNAFKAHTNILAFLGSSQHRLFHVKQSNLSKKYYNYIKNGVKGNNSSQNHLKVNCL